MPELPEVETVRRGLAPVLEGRLIAAVTARRAGLRFPFPPRFAERLTGRRVVYLARRAKYLLAGLDSGEVLLLHLGMTGRFTVLPPHGGPRNLGEFYYETGAGPEGGGRHDHLVIDLDDGTRIVYTDPRRFGLADLIDAAAGGRHPLLDGLGIEPLGNELNADRLAALLAGRRAPLKAALLDQRLIAGLGNIYVCEALWRAGLSPRRLAGTVAPGGKPGARAERLAAAIRAVLDEAVAAGGSTLRDYARADGSPGAFQDRFDVYDRAGEPCRRPGCGGTVARIVQSGRSSFLCPRCQR